MSWIFSNKTSVITFKSCLNSIRKKCHLENFPDYNPLTGQERMRARKKSFLSFAHYETENEKNAVNVLSLCSGAEERSRRKLFFLLFFRQQFFLHFFFYIFFIIVLGNEQKSPLAEGRWTEK